MQSFFQVKWDCVLQIVRGLNGFYLCDIVNQKSTLIFSTMIVDLSTYPCISINFDHIFAVCIKCITFLVVLTCWHNETFIIIIIFKSLWKKKNLRECREKKKKKKTKNVFGAYLMVHWLGIHLAIQGTLVQSLAWEDPTCQEATKPVHN